MYNFYFISFSSFSNQFWLEMNPQWYFFNFFNFFWNFLLPVWKERNETIIFIFHVSHTFPTYFGLKWTIIVFLLFFEFFTIFMEFSITLRVRMEWKHNFFFRSLSQSFPTYFCLKWSRNGIFLIFWIFLLFFFGIFCYASDRFETEL